MTVDEAIATTLTVGPELQYAVEQFLYHEAELLDDGKYREWLELVDEDVVYQLSTRPTVDALDAAREPSALAMDDDWQSLMWRVKRAETGMAWAEEPASRLRYLITNVRIAVTPAGVIADCNFLRYRNRLERTEHILVGRRHDLLRPRGSGFALARRTVTLDQNVLLTNNLSMIF